MKNKKEINSTYDGLLSPISINSPFSGVLYEMTMSEAAGHVISGSYLGELILSDPQAIEKLEIYADLLIAIGNEINKVIIKGTA